MGGSGRNSRLGDDDDAHARTAAKRLSRREDACGGGGGDEETNVQRAEKIKEIKSYTVGTNGGVGWGWGRDNMFKVERVNRQGPSLSVDDLSSQTERILTALGINLATGD